MSARLEELRITCDMMHVFVIIDEYTDVEGPASVRQIVDTIADALEDPHKPRPTGENNLGKVVQQ